MNWIKECEAAARALPQPLRQAILDDIRSGKTIGQTRNSHEVSLAAVCGVIDMNIVQHSALTLAAESK